MKRRCALVGVPVEDGAGRPGLEMGPAALRAAGLAPALEALGHEVTARASVSPAPPKPAGHRNAAVKRLAEVAAWTETLMAVAFAESAEAMPIFVGGDHSLSAGTLPGLARRAEALGRPLYVLWLDAHPDFHTLDTTVSGNLHGVPMAYATGRPGFEDVFPPLPARIDPRRVCMAGIRSVDPAEKAALAEAGVTVHDMRAIDEHGIGALLRPFLAEVEAAEGMLHVSFDVDFLDPSIAPAVGTTVPGGATFREAHLVMEMLHDSGLVTSLDLVELNPFLDERGRTASLLVDLVASLMGRRVMEYPTRSARA